MTFAPSAALLEAPLDVTSGPPDHPGVIVVNGALDLRSEVQGLVAELFAELGETVPSGHALLEMSTPELDAELAMAEAAVGAASAELRSRLVAAANARVRLARRRSAARAVSEEELVTAEAELQVARSEVRVARATVDSRRARLEQLRALAEHRILRAPFDGVVDLRWRERHARVEPGDRLLRFLPMTPPIVRFAVPAERAPEVEPGRAIEVRLDQESRQATITHRSSSVDPASGLVLAEGRFDCTGDTCSGLLDGLAVRVRTSSSVVRTSTGTGGR